jgi:uncharacterized membrane protein YhaH (DUF805 family)
MGPAQAIRTGLAKSFQFSGRASRAEFWWFAPCGFALPALVIGLGYPRVTDHETVAPVLLAAAIAALPVSAVSVRRLHDADKSGFVFLSGLVSTFITGAGLLVVSVGLFGLVTVVYATKGVLLIGLGLAILSFNAAGGPGILDLLFGLTAPSTPDVNRYGPPPSEVTS